MAKMISKYKMKMFSYRAKVFFRDLFGSDSRNQSSRVFSIFAILIIILIVASVSVYGLGLKSGAQGETRISAETFNKIVYYNANAGTWKTFNTTDTEDVISMGVDSSFAMIYATATKVKKIGSILSPNNPETDITAAYVSAGGNPANIVDITAADEFIYILEKNGKIRYTSNAGASFIATHPIPTFPNLVNNAQYIGSAGRSLPSGDAIVYGDGSLAFWSGAIWTDIGRNYDFNTYGKATSVEWMVGYLMITTDKGYILQTNNFTNYVVAGHKSPGGYIYGNLYHNGSVYLFGSALNADRSTVGFMLYDGVNPPTLEAVIPGCKISKSVAYFIAGNVGYAATVSDTCEPNNPTPPAPPPTPPATNTTLTYDGVSIHTKARNISRPEAAYSATAKRGLNDTIEFTLTVTNASASATTTDVKFTLPAGFTFQGMTSGSTPTSGPDGTGTIYWNGYNAPAGESSLVFTTQAP